MKKTIVINLFGGPGSGKSTTCAGIFERLKLKGINAEMALEYAKDKVWEKSYHTLDNQIYVFGKQLHRIFRLKDDVDIIITDSPLILSIHYDKDNNSALRQLVLGEYNKFDNINLFIRRGELPYNPKGRYQTENEAKEIDKELENLLDELDVKYTNINKGETDKAIEIIENYLQTPKLVFNKSPFWHFTIETSLLDDKKIVDFNFNGINLKKDEAVPFYQKYIGKWWSSPNSNYHYYYFEDIAPYKNNFGDRYICKMQYYVKPLYTGNEPIKGKIESILKDESLLQLNEVKDFKPPI